MLTNRVSASQAIDFLHLAQNLKVRPFKLQSAMKFNLTNDDTLLSPANAIKSTDYAHAADNEENGLGPMQCKGLREHCRPHVQNEPHEPHMWS